MVGGVRGLVNGSRGVAPQNPAIAARGIEPMMESNDEGSGTAILQDESRIASLEAENPTQTSVRRPNAIMYAELL
jgi:hypothetical protein